jgi:hypothetical protein
MIKFLCPHCGVKISAESEYAGVAANCPTCARDLLVPSQPAEQLANPSAVLEYETVGTPGDGSKGRAQLKRPGSRRMIKIVVPALLCVLVTSGIVVVVNSKSGGSDVRVTESPPAQAKQKTNQAGYDAYMTGYNDPEQGDVAEAMFDRFSGGERQAALLMILGAEDRRKNLPIRFVVVSE